MSKLTALLLALLLLLALPGCSFTGLSPQNLMSPPKANADQQSIYRLLQGTQTDVTFIYPRNGEYRSAIIMQDFTGNGTEDAIGFRLAEDGGVEVQFLMKLESGEWGAAAAFQNRATQVDRVCFGSLGDGRQAVFIGWGNPSGATGRTAAVNAYVYEGDGNVAEHSLGNYGEFLLTDFDEDGVNELFTIDKYVLPAEGEGEASAPASAQARLFAFEGNQPQEMASATADNSITNYSSVVFGWLNSQTQGVVVDGADANGSTTTQIFVLENGQLKNYPEGVNTEEYANRFARPAAASFLARDINGDGCIEFPTVTPLPGLPEDIAPDSTSFLVEWRAMTPDMDSRVILRALMNPRENYWFRLPFSLQGRICAINDPERRTVTYTLVTTDEQGRQLLSGNLFSIRVFTRTGWESRGESSGYTWLAAQGDGVYGIQIYTDNEYYAGLIEKAAMSFQLLSD